MKDKNLGIGEMIKLGLILVCYAVASCAVLAIVNSFTSVKIKQNQLDAANKAMKEVFASADSFVPVDDFLSVSGNISVSNFYLAKQNDKIVGGVCQVSGPTYDKGKIIVGADLNGIVTGMQILELSEEDKTIVARARRARNFLSQPFNVAEQFSGLKIKDGFTVNKTFDGISGATITSKAIGDLVTQGTSSISEYLEAHNYE